MGDAKAVGIGHDSSLLFEESGKGSADAWGSVSARTSDYRSARRCKMEFDEEDRKQTGEPEKPEIQRDHLPSTEKRPVSLSPLFTPGSLIPQRLNGRGMVCSADVGY